MEDPKRLWPPVGSDPAGCPAIATLVKLDDQRAWKEGWVFPDEVIKKVQPMSVSGGSWGPDGNLYCTGHDPPQTYELRPPRAGSILELIDTVPCNIAGQGIAWDRPWVQATSATSGLLGIEAAGDFATGVEAVNGAVPSADQILSVNGKTVVFVGNPGNSPVSVQGL